MSYGMTYDLYWKGDTMATVAYRKKFDVDRENRNAELWLQGMYDYEAFGVVLGNAFRKKGAKPVSYSKEPYRITPLTPEEEEEKKEQELQKAYAAFDRMISAQKAQGNQHGN